jgi:catechol 2,3-dioxygenase-like lactoylglutathione lyase family enzyme
MIQHVTREIAPDLLASCIAFYRLLGFDPAQQPPAIAQRAVWLQLGGTQLHLMPTAGAGPERGHIAIVAPDYERTVRSLTAAGHAVEPRAEHWGSPRAYVRDPAGNLVELMERAPGQTGADRTIDCPSAER